MMETKSLVCDRYAQKLAEKKHYIKYQEFHWRPRKTSSQNDR
jgi:hypothetical protein